MTGSVSYIAVFIFAFFAASYLIARYTDNSPTEPLIFLLSVGLSLVWPLTLPLAVVGLLLFVIARMADALAAKQKRENDERNER